MADKRGSAREASMRMAFCGMMTALTAALMLSAGVIPIATYAAPLLAAVLLIPVRVEYSARAALGVWLASCLLVFLLGLDKEAACFYAFVGWYPAVKWALDFRVRRRGLLLLIKAGIFAACVALMYLLLAAVLRLDAVLDDLAELGLWMSLVFGAVLVLSLLLWDRLLAPLAILYATRLRPKLRFLRG